MSRGIILFICMSLFSGCILNPYLKPNKPAQQVKVNPSVSPPTFEEADLNKDGKLDKNETALANKIEESQESKWPPHLTAFIAIVAAVIVVCVVCMIIAGFRGKPRSRDSSDTTNTGFGNFFGLLKEEDEKETIEEDFMGDGSTTTTPPSGSSG